MPSVRLIVLAACLLMAIAARAEDAPIPLPAMGDVVYKGFVGKALDAVPMAPEQRVALQRTNAVVSNTLSGRSLSVWVGLTNPLLFIAGLAWGLYAASQIRAEDAGPKPYMERVQPFEPVEIAQNQVALLHGSPVEEEFCE